MRGGEGTRLNIMVGDAGHPKGEAGIVDENIHIFKVSRQLMRHTFNGLEVTHVQLDNMNRRLCESSRRTCTAIAIDRHAGRCATESTGLISGHKCTPVRWCSWQLLLQVPQSAALQHTPGTVPAAALQAPAVDLRDALR